MSRAFWPAGPAGDTLIRQDLTTAADYLADDGVLITDASLGDFIGLHRNQLRTYRERVEWSIEHIRSEALRRKADRWRANGRPVTAVAGS